MIDTQLQQLETTGLIQRAQIEPELEYLFRHALIQDAAYGSLLRTQRRWLHQAVGEALEGLYPERRGELAAVLAAHFAEAGDAARARDYYLQAGAGALATYANAEAAAHYRAALDRAHTPGARAGALDGLGTAQARLGHFAAAIAAWRAAITCYQAGGDADSMARLFARSARAAWNSGDVPAGLELAREGLAATESAPETAGRAALLHEAARAAFFNGLSDNALAWGAQAQALAARLGAVEIEAEALITYAITVRADHTREAIAALQQALALATAAHLPLTMIRAHYNLVGPVGFTEGDFTAARAHLEQAAALARRIGDRLFEQLCRMELASVAFEVGDFAEAAAILVEIRAAAAGTPNPTLELEIALLEARLLVSRGYVPEALAQLTEVEATAQAAGAVRNAALTAYLRAEILLTEGTGEAAAAIVDRLLATDMGKMFDAIGIQCLLSQVRAHEGRVEEARALLDELRALLGPDLVAARIEVLNLATARVAVIEGRIAEALAAYAAVAAVLERMGKRWFAAHLRLEWAAAYRARGTPADDEAARACLHEAIARFTALGVPRWAAQARDLLG